MRPIVASQTEHDEASGSFGRIGTYVAKVNIQRDQDTLLALTDSGNSFITAAAKTLLEDRERIVTCIKKQGSGLSGQILIDLESHS